MQRVHARVNELCRELGAGNGRAALALCDGFGVPEVALQGSVVARPGGWRTFQG